MLSRSRLSLVLASVLLAGTAITPAAVADEPPAAPGTASGALADHRSTPSSELPPLTPEDARAVQERASRLLREHPEAAAGFDQQSTGPVNPTVTRHAGPNRYATAANLATTFWRDLFWNEEVGGPLDVDKVVFVASGTTFPDALAAGPLAASYGGPILLTRKDSLPTAPPISPATCSSGVPAGPT